MRLIKLLQQAYAIEIGAYEAYEGHWRSLKLPQERSQIQAIQLEELEHRENLDRMLKELKAEPNRAYNFMLLVIGKTISFGCKIMGYRLAMWGAGIMEKLGGFTYKQLAREARDEGYPWMACDLDDMQAAEERHEKFFKEKLG